MVDIDFRSSLPIVCDQGHRSTCVAFAVSAAHAVARSYGAFYDALSEEMVYWLAMEIGCHSDGISLSSANSALTATGQCRYDLWPYDHASIPIRQQPGEPALTDAKLRRATLSFIGNHSSDVEANLIVGNPVILITSMCQQFRSTTSGFVSTPTIADSLLGNHAVLCVGLINHPKFGEVFVIRNSWGPGWGDLGYGYLDTRFLNLFLLEAAVVSPIIDHKV